MESERLTVMFCAFSAPKNHAALLASKGGGTGQGGMAGLDQAAFKPSWGTADYRRQRRIHPDHVRIWGPDSHSPKCSEPK
jgi:hypothetical protein